MKFNQSKKQRVNYQVANVLSMFTDAVKILTKACDESNDIINDNRKVINDLTEENNELNVVVSNNKKIIENINNILNV